MASRTQLTFLVKQHQWGELLAVLAKDSSLLHHRDRKGRGWLHLTSSVDIQQQGRSAEDSIKTADVLIDTGLGINEAAVREGVWQATPLWFAVAHGRNIALAAHLLNRGADPDHCLWAAVNQDSPETIRLLIARGAPDPTNSETSPLLAAIDWNKLAAAEALLELGADPNYRNDKATTPLHCAIRKRRGKDCIEMLIRHGARGDLADGNGVTAIDLLNRKRDPALKELAGQLSKEK